MSRFDRELVGAVVRPRSTMAALAEARAPAGGLFAVLTLAGTYSTFCLVLWASGHAPSRPGAFGLIPAEGYYLAQAAFLPLLFPLLWLILGGAAHVVARAMGGRGDLRAGLAALGFAYGAPLTLAYVLPDLLVFLVFGFDAMVTGMRLYGPLALGWTLWLCTVAVRESYRMGTGPAAVAVFAGFVAQGIVGGLFIR